MVRRCCGARRAARCGGSSRGRALTSRRSARVPLGRRPPRSQQQLESATRSSESPLARRVRLAEPDLARASRGAGRARSRGSSSRPPGPRRTPRRPVRQPSTTSVPPSRPASARSRTRDGHALERAAARRAASRRSARSTCSSPHRPLAGDERRLVVERHALQPEPQRLPVDERRSPAAASAGSGRGSRASDAFVSSRAAAVQHCGQRPPPRPRGRGCAPRPRPRAARTRTRSSGRGRRTARRAAASRARSGAPAPRSSSGRRSPKVLFSSATMHASAPSPP